MWQFKSASHWIIAIIFIVYSAVALSGPQQLSVMLKVGKQEMIMDKDTLESVKIMPSLGEHTRPGDADITLILKDKAAAQLETFTKNNLGKQLQVLVNGRALITTTIQTVVSKQFTIPNVNLKDAAELFFSLSHKPIPINN